MCPQCRAFISSDDKTCPYCNETVGSRAASVRPQDAFSSMVPEHSTMTLMFLLLNVAFWVSSVIISANQGGGNNPIMDLDSRTLILLGGKWRPEILYGGQWWRLLTAGFLHGGAMHIVMNGMSLYQVGRHFEDFLGPVRLFLVYFIATICGFGLSLYSSGSLSVGASAAIAGLVGALYASSRFTGSPTAAGQKLYGYWTLGLLIVGFLGNWSNMMRIDNAAHIGGWVAGYLLITAAGFPGSNRSTREFVLRILLIVAVAATLLSFWKMGSFFIEKAPTSAYQRQ